MKTKKTAKRLDARCYCERCVISHHPRASVPTWEELEGEALAAAGKVPTFEEMEAEDAAKR